MKPADNPLYCCVDGHNHKILYTQHDFILLKLTFSTPFNLSTNFMEENSSSGDSRLSASPEVTSLSCNPKDHFRPLLDHISKHTSPIHTIFHTTTFLDPLILHSHLRLSPN
jgi:hypothetical protein